MVGEGVTQMGTCELQWRGPERKTIEVDGMLREGGAERRISSSPQTPPLVPSVLQGLTLRGRVHLQWPHLTTILPRCWVGLVLCLFFSYFILTSFRCMTYRSKAFLQGDDWWNYRRGALSCNSGSLGLRRRSAIDAKATRETRLLCRYFQGLSSSQ